MEAQPLVGLRPEWWAGPSADHCGHFAVRGSPLATRHNGRSGCMCRYRHPDLHADSYPVLSQAFTA